jgi:hypothetical protein
MLTSETATAASRLFATARPWACLGIAHDFALLEQRAGEDQIALEYGFPSDRSFQGPLFDRVKMFGPIPRAPLTSVRLVRSPSRAFGERLPTVVPYGQG